MKVNASLRAQKTKVILKTSVVLPALDQRAHRFVEGLNPNLELERACGEFRNDVAQGGRQAVRDHFEMEKMPGLITLEKEFEDRFAHVHVEVESAIHELELPDSSRD